MSAPAKASRSQRQRRPCLPQRQRGIALLVAILLVAIGTILAAAVGYESASQFGREFKRFFGAPPSEEAGKLRTSISTLDG